MIELPFIVNMYIVAFSAAGIAMLGTGLFEYFRHRRKVIK